MEQEECNSVGSCCRRYPGASTIRFLEQAKTQLSFDARVKLRDASIITIPLGALSLEVLSWFSIWSGHSASTDERTEKGSLFNTGSFGRLLSDHQKHLRDTCIDSSSDGCKRNCSRRANVCCWWKDKGRRGSSDAIAELAALSPPIPNGRK